MSKVVVLDIETVPDPVAVERSKTDVGEGFLPWPFHALACASVLTVERNAMDKPTFEIETYSRRTSGERGIVAAVERSIENATVVTFNGRGFDVPVLLARAALCGEPAPTIGRLHGQNRYRPGLHHDLLDQVSGFGAAPKPKLSDLCAAFGVPVKIDAAGNEVAALVEQGDFARVEKYCETDVVSTWLAYLFWQSAERFSPEIVTEGWSRLASWILHDQPRLVHLRPYADPPTSFGGGSAMGEVDFAEFGL